DLPDAVCSRAQQSLSLPLVIRECDRLVRFDHRLNWASGIHPQTFGLAEEQAGTNQRKNNPGRSQRQQELSSLAVDQHNAADGHQKVNDGENNVAPMSLDVGETALQENVGVIADDG